ncbi:NAD-dependent succinate-semialdehyde dehydrogenase [Aeromicrobium sp. YIM 150415]|uniref:NAD-dependent succinate-semialdehyde dehydrogenase n=1 Tax=Aeromicrobium sp. YIM 150415 TaxID=2803912 RepID=UPI00196531E4|nr:NAD-dependent succinate-semialdehyde dehydrogenase [Aeromicrobium sp. YIM 150415]MBM9464523.1 NAD-dependent succinate-semialdehyde dehydrogenase [Aeromicrobium sp. YIM 150415]
MTAPTTVDEVSAGLPSGLLIDGRWERVDETFPVVDPATEKPIARVADASVAHGLRALDSIVDAAPGWAATTFRERAELLRRAFDALTARREEFARLIATEMGKPLEEARGEVDYGAEFLRWYAEEVSRPEGDYRRSPDGGSRILVSRRPIGPCLLITPWNFPLAMATRKVAAALAAGCTAILKPAPQTPLTSLRFAQLLLDAGLPAGVLNVVTTMDAPAVCGALLADGRIRKVSFTGSTAVGRLLIAQCGPQVVRPSMELGGNAPFIVDEDADLDRAVEGAMIAKMRNMGQACTAANRFLVHRRVADEFGRRLAERMRDLTVGHGLDPLSQVGPMIDGAACDKLAGLVRDAVDHGARLLTGGSPLPGPGTFFEPTVLTDVSPGSRMFADEIFGPVAGVTCFDDLDEAVAVANDTEYGLVAYLYSGNTEKALRTAERLDVGMVALNRALVSNAAAPFGGIKQSGLGREGGREGINDYLDLQYVAIDA